MKNLRCDIEECKHHKFNTKGHWVCTAGFDATNDCIRTQQLTRIADALEILARKNGCRK